MTKTANIKKLFRRRRTRKKIGKGTAKKPRLSVFRSHKYIYGQAIDDEAGITMFSASSVNADKGKTKKEKAFEVGKILAKKASEVGVKDVVFDKGHYSYHGRIRRLAEGAREEGLNF